MTYWQYVHCRLFVSDLPSLVVLLLCSCFSPAAALGIGLNTWPNVQLTIFYSIFSTYLACHKSKILRHSGLLLQKTVQCSPSSWAMLSIFYHHSTILTNVFLCVVFFHYKFVAFYSLFFLKLFWWFFHWTYSPFYHCYDLSPNDQCSALCWCAFS